MSFTHAWRDAGWVMTKGPTPPDGTKGRANDGLFPGLGGPADRPEQADQLPDIAAIAICAVICGADSWVCVELFGRSKEDWMACATAVRHPEQGTRAHRAAGLLGHRRPGLPGIPERGGGMARAAPGGEGGAPMGDRPRAGDARKRGARHGAGQVLHQQPGGVGAAAAGGGAGSLEHRELIALEHGRDLQG